MASASELLGSGFVAVGSQTASGNGWLVDPDLNVSGADISTFYFKENTGNGEVRVGADKVTPSNNRLLVDGISDTVSFTGIRLTPGEGLYVASAVKCRISFDYL